MPDYNETLLILKLVVLLGKVGVLLYGMTKENCNHFIDSFGEIVVYLGLGIEPLSVPHSHEMQT